MSHFVLILFGLLALAGCQVKEEKGNGQLIAGHTPATNAFTVSGPANSTYKAGDVLSFNLSFPYNVAIAGGVPSLSITIGASTVAAPLISGAGSKTLLFQYTVLASENDANGVALNSLALNGATMTFTNAGATTNCDISTVTARTYSNVIVDNTGPTLTGFSLVTLPGFYNEGDAIVFSATYSEPVIVGAPAPSISLTFNTAASATYVSGSGTNTINFQYTVTSTQFDLNGYAFASTTFVNGASITDASGNAAAIDFSAYSAAIAGGGGTSNLVEFDGRAPYIVNIVPPTPGSYAAAQNLDYIVEFNKNVTISTLPYLALTVGAATRQASYSSGSGSRFITFRYTTVPGDVDADGITSPTSITVNGGTLVSTTGNFDYFVAGNFSNNLFTAPDTSGVIITATQPQPTAVIRGTDTTNRIFPAPLQADNIWIIGQPLLITVEFNTGMFVGQTNGTPFIPLTIGASTVNATYLSGGDGQTSLVFRYVIQEGDLDADGTIQIGNINLNGGTITDAANTNSLLTLPVASVTTTFVDGVRPTISTVTAPANGSYSTITIPANFYFTINWSEAVNFSGGVNLPLTIGASPINASTVVTNNVSAIVVSPLNLTGLNDTDGITVSSPLNGGTVYDQAGNTASTFTFTPPTTTSVLVDTIIPTITSVTPPPADTYNAGEDLTFTVQFSEVVNVQSAGAYPNNYPRLPLALTSGTQYATYISGTGTNTLTFRYTVTASDTHTGTITSPAAIAVNTPTSYIRDAAFNGNTTNSYATTAHSLVGVIVDGVTPTITTRSTVAGVYVPAAQGTNNSLLISLEFNEDITVTGAGTPWIELVMGSGNRIATYDAGASTVRIMRFRYDIDPNDMDLDGMTLASASIDPDGNTIEDLNGNAANLSIGGTVTDLINVNIAPHAIVWMRASLGTNRSAMTGAPGFSTTAPLTASYYNFSGTETMSFAGLSGFSTRDVFIALRTPPDTDLPVTQEIIDNYVTLDVPTGNLTVTGTGPGNLAANSLHQVQFNLAGASVPDSMIPAGFTGRVAEILIFNSALTAGQQAHVNSFLSGTY